MKLTLKELAPYLPYNIEVEFNSMGLDGKLSIDNLTGISNGICYIGKGGRFGYYKRDIFEIKPILQPLEFKDFTSRDYTYNEWCFFFKEHMDVFGLIEKGLAININDLK